MFLLVTISLFHYSPQTMWLLTVKNSNSSSHGQTVSHDRVKVDFGRRGTLEMTLRGNTSQVSAVFSAATSAPYEEKKSVESKAACRGPPKPGADDRTRLEKLMRSAILIG